MIGLLINILVIGLLYWIITIVPIDQWFKDIAKVIAMVAVVLCIIFALMGLSGMDYSNFNHWR